MLPSLGMTHLQPSMITSVPQTLRFAVAILSLLVLVTAAYNMRHQTYVDPKIPGETFPSCVEVVAIWPEPYSVLIPSSMDSEYATYEFRIKFSRPIFISWKDSTGGYHPDPRGNFMIFLTPSAYNYMYERHKPQHLGYWQSSRKMIIAKFKLRRGHLDAIARKVFLVVDGEAFHTWEKIGRQRYPVFAPLGVYGEYYFHPEDAANKTSFPIQPSPYCNPRIKRPLPVPFPDSSEDFSVELPVRGHRLELVTSGDGGEGKQFVLQLSAVIRGKGRESVVLPKTVVAQYNGTNITVKLPPGSLTFENTWLQLHVPVEKKLVFELRERIYHRFDYKLVPAPAIPMFLLNMFPRDGYPKMSVTKHPHVNAWRVEIYDPDTDIAFMNFFAYTTSKWFRGLHANTPDWLQARWMEESAAHWLKWIKCSYTASTFGHYPFVDDDLRKDIAKIPKRKKLLMYPARECPAGSKRNQGRHGKLHHILEHGPFYHMLVPRPVNEWGVETKRRVIMIAENGTESDLTGFASFGAEGGDGVPPRITEALQKYFCLARPLRRELYNGNPWMKRLQLDECIFVPRETVESRECGGLRLTENLRKLTQDDPDFCEKDFGDCIGLPYSSVERFPVIPTYGLEELTGWFHSPNPLPADLQHPLGRHIQNGERMFPRSVLMQEKENWLRLTPFISNRIHMPVKNVPLSGVEILEPYLSQQGGERKARSGFCAFMWKMEPHTSDPIRETEATLVATVNNSGEGGGDFVFEVRCTPELLVKPSWGRIQQWVPALSTTSVQFKLDGKLAAGADKKVHHCEVSVQVETAPEISSSDQAPLKCSKWITTYYGAFQDPCSLPATPLPNMELVYFQLPASQRSSSALAQKQLINSPVGKTLSFVKAITVNLSVPAEDEDLLFNIHNLKVFCDNPRVVVMQEDQLLHGATQSTQDPGYVLPRTPLSFYIDLNTRRKVFFYADNEWLKSQNGSFSSSSSVQNASGCAVEVWANRPHRLCTSNPQLQARVHVPLTEADIRAVTQEVAGRFWFLNPVYGRQRDEVAVALMLCLATTMVLIAATASGHSVMYLMRKKLPKETTLKSFKQQLERVKSTDKSYWENPQNYLTPGPHGPYYHLHSFKATGPLDTKELKSLQIAGTLRYKSKELQVLFGHLKKVFVNKGGKDRNVWLQASSGMYLLSFHNVAPDYKADFTAFLQKNGVSVEEGSTPESQAPVLTTKMM